METINVFSAKTRAATPAVSV